MKYYKTTEQITELTEYQFKLPKYGKSTTDPTYYEPSATRIANMRKSAQSGKSLYDFDGSDLPKMKNAAGKEVPDWSKQDISKARITPGRKPGLTREEISQNVTDSQNDLQNEIFKRQVETEDLNKQIKTSKSILKSLNEGEAQPANE